MTLHLTWMVWLINSRHQLLTLLTNMLRSQPDNRFPGIRSTLSLQSKNVEKQNEDGITLGWLFIETFSNTIAAKLIAKVTAKYYQDAIIECSDSKSLFRVMDHLLKRKSEPKLPSFTSAEDLSNRFANYFSDKITNIRTVIPEKQKKRWLWLWTT